MAGVVVLPALILGTADRSDTRRLSTPSTWPLGDIVDPIVQMILRHHLVVLHVLGAVDQLKGAKRQIK
jgi:hypothetical protein